MMMTTWKCTAQRYLFARSKFRIAASVFLPTAYSKLSFVQYADCETRVGSLYSFVFFSRLLVSSRLSTVYWHPPP